MDTHPAVRVVIVGGGFGGLETGLYLRKRLGDRVAVTLVAERPHFVFRPYLSYVPFGLVPDDVRFDLAAVGRAQDLDFLEGRVDGVDPAARLVHVGDRRLPYDYLVVATGARAAPEPVPGLYAHGYVL